MPHRLNEGERYTGQAGLIHRLGLKVPWPFVLSIVGAGTRRSVVEARREIERYAAGYDYGDTAVGDLKFALRYEPTDLRVLNAAFARIEPQALTGWIESEPTGAFSRRAWFLYEYLTGQRLPLPDSRPVKYVPALDPEKHIVLPDDAARKSHRHRVLDNLLGTPAFCPTVRRTARLAELMATPIADEAMRLVEGCDPGTLRRAIQYLFTKETRSSFEIEDEPIDDTKAARFVHALQQVEEFDPTEKADYIKLQNLIISDPRFQAQDWRSNQNFIGSAIRGYQQRLHYVCPRPQDVAPLMAGLQALAPRLRRSIDPVVAAALLSFGFVFIHPFEDGNGRIHRFLVHRVLAEAGVTPPGILFPVSAAMVRDRAGYDAALEAFSDSVMPYIPWNWVGGIEGGEIEVRNDTLDLYRFFDATPQAEYLYEKVIETVRKDLREELDYVAVYDIAYRAVSDRLDGLPGSKVSLLVSLCLQNEGRLARGKHRLFAMLTSEEITAAEGIVQAALAEQAERRAE